MQRPSGSKEMLQNEISTLYWSHDATGLPVTWSKVTDGGSFIEIFGVRKMLSSKSYIDLYIRSTLPAFQATEKLFMLDRHMMKD